MPNGEPLFEEEPQEQEVYETLDFGREEEKQGRRNRGLKLTTAAIQNITKLSWSF
ncbi:MAG TPA: hypothetical protein VE521_00420 [Nitrososphaera sp.]|jgi:hypothetical protein|nr:hypothetical protein [Nitrososphaera sp.]